jgi:signal transduction histidine kinase
MENESTMKQTDINFIADINAITQIPVVDSILEVVCQTTGMGFAAIARVTKDKWIACAVKDEINFGLQPGGELAIETTICHEIENSRTGVIIDHVAEDERFMQHHTPLLYGFQSYISMPIILKDGRFFGTLCAIDPNPAKLNNAATIGMFKLFTDLISFHLHAIEELNISQQSLAEEQHTSELRDQFIAILGHDLRNPVGAIRNSAQLLLRNTLNERQIRLVNIIHDSTYRITGLIENVLDFARGRLGSGITLTLNADEQLKPILNQVVSELQTIWPDREIQVIYDLIEPVKCDGKRIAQLFSNLLGNALTYGDPATPVKVKTACSKGEFLLSVTNSGKQIPSAKLARLFQPFSRGEGEQDKEGLGLGLYISSQIALAHHGRLTVTSREDETCFTLTFPSR